MKELLLLPGMRRVHGGVVSFAYAALVLLMPIAPTVLPLLLVIGTAALVVRHRLWRLGSVSSLGFGTAMPWMFLLYMLHLIGLGWTTNWDYASFDLQIKLPLALLPVIFLQLPAGSQRCWRELLAPFIVGNAIAVVLGLLSVPYRLTTDPSAVLAQAIFGEHFSWMVHPSYFAMYLCFALAALFLAPVPMLSNALRTGLAALFCVGIVCCGSKAGWIALPVVLLVLLVARWTDRSIRRSLFTLIAVSSLGAFVLIAASPNVRERLVEAWQALSRTERVADADTSSEVRKLAWHSAAQVAEAHAPWGTGTGDVKDELIAAHERNGYVHLVEKRINAHSEYLQLWAALGVVGVLLLIMSAVVPLVRAVRGKDVLVALFFLLNAANWAVESMLEVQAGVLFFAFFAFVLALPDPHTIESDLP